MSCTRMGGLAHIFSRNTFFLAVGSVNTDFIINNYKVFIISKNMTKLR